MKKLISLISVSFTLSILCLLVAQKNDPEVLYERFVKSYRAGDLIGSEKNLLLLLNSKDSLSIEYKISTLNNLGITYNLLGKYKESLGYYSKAEALLRSKQIISQSLGDIYINKAIIYSIQKSYSVAFEYFEKGIRIYDDMPASDKRISSSLASAYLNYGIVLLDVKDYPSALNLFNKSAEIKLKNDLPGLALAYLNIAKTFAKTDNPEQAEKFYIKSIEKFTSEFNENYFRLAEVYFDYGLFLRSEGRNSEALEAHKKALSICLRNYGEKHTLTSLSYKHLGDHFLNQSDYETALAYYQKSLISIVNNFNFTDIFTNPAIDSSLFEIRLLDNLKGKALALEQYAYEQSERETEIKILYSSLGTIELALRLIDRIRGNYLTEESRMYLAENEKETFIAAIGIGSSLYKLTNESLLIQKMYSMAQDTKASVLQNEITQNELLYSSGIPDSLLEKQNSLTGMIASYNNLILEEFRTIKPDSAKISLWKDNIFEMNREKERLKEQISREFPEFNDLWLKTKPLPLAEIRRELRSDETVVDYLLSNQYINGKRMLYVFLITRDNLAFRETSVDSTFKRNAEIIQIGDRPYYNNGNHSVNYLKYTNALNYMYDNLILPFRELFSGNKLIIIPDEEIAWLPFDAFLEQKPVAETADYEGLSYLIYDFVITYGYSSSLIFNRSKPSERRMEVYAFSPYYSSSDIGGKTPRILIGAAEEIEAVYEWFKGRKFTGNEATETNFRSILNEPAIFHLAMHSITDTVNSKYSFLMFDSKNDTLEDGKLYNYEISLMRLRSPLVVLSACNSGTGTIYYGEGLMSLARGFILAGASSIVKTAWEINDEVSAAIIIRFYHYLSKGMKKNEALRKSKLDFINENPPSLKNPYYWAAYEVLGDTDPILRRGNTSLLMISILTLSVVGMMYFYFRRRRIFSDRSM